MLLLSYSKLYQIITFLLLLYLYECHQKSQNKRIVGGKLTKIEKHPYMIALILKFKNADPGFKCGGQIVSKYWALTAAHCCKRFSRAQIDGRVVYIRGNTTNWTDKKYAIDHKIIDYYRHPKYGLKSNEDCDVAILKVNPPFTGKYEKPIKIASRNFKVKMYRYATIVGWGKTAYVNHYVEEELRSASISIFKQDKCKRYKLSNTWRITSNMICAGTGKGGIDACAGDSGGPLIQSGVLIGIVSYGKKCGLPDYPGVYAKVGNFQDWFLALEKRLNTKFHIHYTDH